MSLKPAISSHSLGRAWVHDLPRKLDAAQQYGLGIELFYEDLLQVAKEMSDGPTEANLILAAFTVRSWCEERGISIVSLQPFMHYEGLLDRQRHAERIEEMKLWIRLANVLSTDTIAIPSTFLAPGETSGDIELIVDDLREVADLGAPEGIRFAYEALCWGTHVDTWERSWQIVQSVDRFNFGICLDTFNIAGRIYADPESPSGKTKTADVDIDESLERLKKIDPKKIYSLQVVDAERLASPLIPGHDMYNAEQPSRMSWSRNCRLFYGEEEQGAYLPIQKILKTILIDLGYTGPVAAEVFHACLTEPASEMPQMLAARAGASWLRILRDFGFLRPTLERSRSSRVEMTPHL